MQGHTFMEEKKFKTQMVKMPSQKTISDSQHTTDE